MGDDKKVTSIDSARKPVEIGGKSWKSSDEFVLAYQRAARVEYEEGTSHFEEMDFAKAVLKRLGVEPSVENAKKTIEVFNLREREMERKEGRDAGRQAVRRKPRKIPPYIRRVK